MWALHVGIPFSGGLGLGVDYPRGVAILLKTESRMNMNMNMNTNALARGRRLGALARPIVLAPTDEIENDLLDAVPLEEHMRVSEPYDDVAAVDQDQVALAIGRVSFLAGVVSATVAFDHEAVADEDVNSPEPALHRRPQPDSPLSQA
jgi:hypothetical protein